MIFLRGLHSKEFPGGKIPKIHHWVAVLHQTKITVNERSIRLECCIGAAWIPRNESR